MPKQWKEQRETKPQEPVAEPSEASSYESAMFAAELGGNAPAIDLHGLTRKEAIYEADAFLHRELGRSEVIRIIHGRGDGNLRAAIHAWLRKERDAHGLIAAFRDSQDPTQQNGMTLVALRRLSTRRTSR